ncbi:glycosyl transferase [Roseobacter cerasinus]|uniref:Glycosyl transferase n=1 Tax=Roseobacter cerasinus TaxID=2602289 RepID=A0A640VVP4_9RHOB|nr:glycosyltransferase family 2 protein [Roseobacter cerasinus]GFE52488.1 glycosyl transferase [Roseobacter cerasinus]
MSAPAPRLSILIVNWNTREMTRDCLASVMAGLGDLAAEVILVDNASEDGSAEMVARDFPQVRLIENTENRGFAAANNQAMEVARGDLLLLLNSDTLVHGDVLAQSVAYLDAQAEVGAMGCRVLNADGSLQRTCSMFPSPLNLALDTFGLSKLPWPRFFGRYHMRYWQRDSTRAVEVISGCYLMLRRTVVDEVGLLDEDFFFFGEETDWCQRMRAAGWELMLAPVGEITHYGGGSVKKLNHKRDIMLFSALVHLNAKHRGPAAAKLTALVLWIYTVTRAGAWSLLGMVRSQAAPRGRHYRAVLTHAREFWMA